MADVKVATFVVDSEKAELGVQRMQRLMQLLGKTAEDARKELSQIFVDTAGKMSGPLDQSKRKVDDNTKAIKDYRQEQRLQNYVVREGSQTVMSLVFALAFLSQGEKDGASTTKVLTQSIMMGVIALNSMEMTAFSLKRTLGTDAAGNLNKFGQFIRNWGGPIAMAVAGLVTLIGYIKESGEASKKAAEEGLKKYREELEKMTLAQRESELKRLEAEYKFYQKQVGLKPAAEVIPRAGGSLAELLGLTNKAAKEGLEITKQEGEAVGKLALETGNLKKLEEEITRLQAQRSKAIDQKEILRLSDEIAKKEYDLGQAKKTTAERTAAAAEKEKILYEIHKSLPAQYLAALNAQKKVTLDAKTRLEIEQKIFDVKQDQIELEEKRNAARLAAAQREADADEALFNLRRDLEIESVLDPMKREEAEQERIHTERLAEIEEQASRANELEEGKRVANLENQRYANALNEIQNKYYVEGLRNLAEGFQAIEQGLSAIGARSDSVLTRMIQMAQIAIRISQALSQMNQPGADQTTGWLNIIGNILGFVGLFQTGGWTGPGSGSQVAGLVHKDEIVFEQPLVQRYRNELLGLRRSMQMGIPTSGMFPSSDNGNLNTAILVNELRSLKQVVRTLEIQVPVIFRNMLDTQKIVREQLPAAQQYYSKKSVDPTS